MYLFFLCGFWYIGIVLIFAASELFSKSKGMQSGFVREPSDITRANLHAKFPIKNPDQTWMATGPATTARHYDCLTGAHNSICRNWKVVCGHLQVNTQYPELFLADLMLFKHLNAPTIGSRK